MVVLLLSMALTEEPLVPRISLTALTLAEYGGNAILELLGRFLKVSLIIYSGDKSLNC